MRKLFLALVLALLFAGNVLAATVSKSFTATGEGGSLSVKVGDSFTYAVSGTFVGTVVLQRSTNSFTWSTVTSATSSASGTVIASSNNANQVTYRWFCTDYTSGTIVTSMADATGYNVPVQEFKNKNGDVIAYTTESGLVVQDLTVTGTSTGVTTTTAGINSAGNVGVNTTSADANLFVNGSATFSGPVTFLGSSPIQFNGNFGIGVVPAYGVQFVDTNGYAIGGDTSADVTNKVLRFGTQSYTISNNPFLGMVLTAQSSANSLYLGGGSTLGVAATDVHILTAANNTTNTGTERFTILSGGNVGVGSVNPENKLVVNGTASMTGFKMATGASNGYVLTTDGNGAGTWQVASGGGGVGVGTVNPGTQNYISVYGSNSTTLGPSTTPFVDNGTNVGIGTSNPNRGTLDVRGNLSVSANIGIGTGAPNNLLWIANGIVSSNGNATTITSAGGSTDIFTITGNSATSASALKASSSGTGYTGSLGSFTLSGNNAGVTGNALFASISGASATGTAALISNLGAGPSLQVNDSSSDASPFLIDAAGNVGIGTTVITGKFQIAGATGIGWTVKTGANTACNTTCPAISGCVFGFDTGLGGSDVVACTDATADTCICAGP